MPLVVTEEPQAATLPSTIQPRPEPLPQVTTAAMETFKCLADRCEDNCCRDWAVPVDRADIANMKAAMSSTPAGRERLVRLVVIGSPSRLSGSRAHLQMDEQNTCPMLQSDNRCGVHATFGEEALTTSCSVFPRTALAVDERIEVGGSLACPEIARLTLLSQTDPQLRPARHPVLPRPYVGKTIPMEAADAYRRHFASVRQTLMKCFGQDLALGTQFVLAADFAERVQSFFYSGTTEFHGAQAAFAEHRLRAEITHTDFQPLHAGLDQDLRKLVASGEAVAGFVASFLNNRRLIPHSDRFASLVSDVIESVARETFEQTGIPGTLPAPSSQQLWQSYARRRDSLNARIGDHATQVFSRYCQHYLMRNPYTDATTLLEHLYGLGINLAAIRFLTLCHPRIAARLAAVPDHQSDREVFDEVAVHVVQTLTKAISHHPAYLEAAIKRSDTEGPKTDGGSITFGQLVLLAKFV